MSLASKLRTFLQSRQKCFLLADYLCFRRKRKRLLEECQNARPTFGIKPKIVVSLTSFPPRFGQLPLCLKSLLRQSVKPDMIIVWLDVTPEMLTPEMRALEKYGVTYRCRVEDLKPHKKYFYALQEFADCLVITVDDDIAYPPDLVATLYKTWRKHPDCICARRVHKMLLDDTGILRPYNAWQFECTSVRKPSHELFATGVGGVLYPPHIFDSDVFDAQRIKDFCLQADDVWLKWHELRLGIPVVWAKNHCIHPPILDGSQTVALSAQNVEHARNDEFIATCQQVVYCYPANRGGVSV